MSTDTVLTVRAVEVTPATAKHPLATKTGMSIFLEYLAADTVWRDCTKPQQRLIAELCDPIIPRLIATGSFTAGDMPKLHSSTHRGLRAALVRRGLVDDSRLTGTAVHAYYWQVWRGQHPRRRRRPIIDVHLPDFEGDSHVD